MQFDVPKWKSTKRGDAAAQILHELKQTKVSKISKKKQKAQTKKALKKNVDEQKLQEATANGTVEKSKKFKKNKLKEKDVTKAKPHEEPRKFAKQSNSSSPKTGKNKPVNTTKKKSKKHVHFPEMELQPTASAASSSKTNIVNHNTSTKQIGKSHKKQTQKNKKATDGANGGKIAKNKNIPKSKFQEKVQKMLAEDGAMKHKATKNKAPVDSMRGQMLKKLKAAKFRQINEELYKTEGKNAQKLFADDPEAFQVYHEGFQSQVSSWPLNPLDVIIKSIRKMNKNKVIADFGCGDAKLAQSVPHKVHSFDLVAVNDKITACDMSKVPLRANTVDVVVFCLSLMGTNLKEYFMEASRVLQIGGVMKIAEIESRFESMNSFEKNVEKFGFTLLKKDDSNKMFCFFDFRKIRNNKKKRTLPVIVLKPCLYKKR